MKFMRYFVALFVLMLAAPALAVNEMPSPRELPQGRQMLMDSDTLPKFTVQKEFLEHGTAEVVDAPGTPHGKVVRMELKTTPREWWHAQIRWRIPGELPKNRTVLLRVLMRATSGQPETGAGKSELGMQKASAPWTRFVPPVAPKLMVGKWVWVDLGLTTSEDIQKNDSTLMMNFGYFPQTLEVADVQTFLFDAGVTQKDLPQPDYFTYDGREADAPWRAAAEERIEKFRKGDLAIRVEDASGKAIPDVQVSVRMKKHAFLFGTCINENLLKQDADGEKYREAVKDNFNIVVHEGAMKWTGMVWNGGKSPDARRKTPEEQQAHLEKVNRILDWCEALGIKTRAHTLIWPGWGNRWAYMPMDLKPMVDSGDKEGVRREIENRIRTATAAFKGRVIEWDVVNESVNNHVLQDLLGREEMVTWYKLAKKYDPGAKTVINDYQMLSGGAQPARIQAFYDEVKFLLDRSAPIDAIGEQAHFAWDLPGMQQSWDILERFAAFGKPMRITEFDVAITDEKLQADYTRDFYTLAFSHPRMEEILMWGFWEGSHWMPSAAMFRKDWSPKPNYHAYRDLVFGKWWTNADVKTDATGAAKVRGFLGDYEVTAKIGGKEVVKQVTLTRDGTKVVLK